MDLRWCREPVACGASGEYPFRDGLVSTSPPPGAGAVGPGRAADAGSPGGGDPGLSAVAPEHPWSYSLDVPTWVWALTVVAIVGMIAFDFFGHVRHAHAPSLREAAIWSSVYVGLAIVFGILVLIFSGPTYGGEYFAGYITEKALSVDNLFVFVLIMSSFAVPRDLQQKVLLIGIALALVLRTIFIVIGAAAIEQFSWVFWIFGAVLLYTAVVQVRSAMKHGEEEEESADYRENAVLRLVRRVVPTSEGYDGDRLITRTKAPAGKAWAITPMVIVLLAIGTADLIFAVDSIPAVFGLTQETYLVFAANAFSLLGLRQLYFLVDGLLDRLVHLGYGLAAILGLIGIKLVIHAMHTNELSWLNGGEHITVVPEIPTPLSLGLIVVILAVVTITSLRSTRGAKDARESLSDAGAGR